MRDLKYIKEEKRFIENKDTKFYVLDRNGKKELAKQYKVKQLKYSGTIPKNITHLIGINDFRLALSHSCYITDNISLQFFYPEYYAKHLIKDEINGVNHTPDATIILKNCKASALLFFEMDCGTEDYNINNQFMKMIRFYLDYFASLKFQKYNSLYNKTNQYSFRTAHVLLLTTKQGRVKNIIKKVESIEQKEYISGDQILLLNDLLSHFWITSTKRQPLKITMRLWKNPHEPKSSRMFR